jgi:hypothetical protein
MSGRVAGAHLGGILGEGDVADVVQGLNPPVAGSVVAGAERGPDRLGRVGGPLGDRGDRPRPGQHRSGRQAQDRDQWVAAATGRLRV